MAEASLSKTWTRRESLRLAGFAVAGGLVLTGLAAAGQVAWLPALALWSVAAFGAVLLLWPGDRVRTASATDRPGGAPGEPLSGDEQGPHEALLRSLPDPILIIRGERILFDNDAARDLVGQTLTGRSLTVLRQPDLLEAIEMVREGQRIDSIDFSMPGKVERHMNARISPIAETGEATAAGPRVVLVLRDITEIRQSERMRGDFVANVSHELRSPLASISGFVETLRGPARDDEKARERFLAIMAEQSERMTNLIEDLLSLSRIEMKEHQPPTTTVDLRELVGTVVDGLTLRAAEKDIELHCEFGAATAIRGDRQELLQLIQNLIDNAIKYARPETRVTIGLGPDQLDLGDRPAGGGTGIVFSVNNKGEPIAREQLPRLTERFYRVDTARSRALGGTGLGLAIVKHVANRHRAELRFESSESAGTTVTCRFPG